MKQPALTLPIGMAGDRKWCVGLHAGDAFADCEDFDGITLTIELRDPAEARAVAEALFAAMARDAAR